MVKKETLAKDAGVVATALILGFLIGVPILGQGLAISYAAKRARDYIKEGD